MRGILRLCLVADTSSSGLRVGARVGRDRRGARAAADGGRRQRDGADEHGAPAVAAGAWCGLALHRARQAAAECFRESLNDRLRDECLNETGSSCSGMRGRCWRRGGRGSRRPAALSAGRPRARLARRAAVLACIKAAKRRLRRWPPASLDPGCARNGSAEYGRDGETALDRTETHRHDGRGGNRDSAFE